MTSSSKQARPNPTGHPGVLVVICLALFFGVVNGSAVAVILPEIGADLDIEAGNLSWILSGFLLAYGVAIPFYGRLATRYGERRLFLFGVVVFAIGSGLASVAGGFATLLTARTIQALGGAAVPGLGMTLASRAFPEERRGLVLGVVSATMGVAAAAGPLVAGVVSAVLDWRFVFVASALAIVSVPLGMKYLDGDEQLSNEPLDLLGGALFGLGVVSTLFSVTRGSQVGWSDSLAVIAAAVAGGSLVMFWRHQGHADSPFIPRSLLANRPYLLLTLLGFAVTFANLAAHIGLPLMFSDLHGASTLDIGIALVPAALATAVFGVIAGRIVDRAGASTPIRAGAILMVAATLTMSIWAGTSLWTVAILMVLFGTGFALVNTPLATVVSLLVSPKDLASALSLNTMMFFIGGSFGATLFTSIVFNAQQGDESVNPLHSGVAVGYSNAFMALAVPVLAALALSNVLPKRRPSQERDADHGVDAWTHDCQVPWTPDLGSVARN